MRVDDQILLLAVVTGDVRVGNAMTRQSLEEFDRVVAVIDAVHEDVVDVDEEVAVGLFEDGPDEVDLGHLLTWRAIVGGVFYRDASLKDCLYATDAIRHVMHRLLGEGDGHQVVDMPVVGAVAQVVAVTTNLVDIEKLLELEQIVRIERCRAAQIEAQAVADKGGAFRDGTEAFTGTPPYLYPVLRRDFPKGNRVRPWSP